MRGALMLGTLLGISLVVTGCSKDEPVVEAAPVASAENDSAGPAKRDYMATVSRPNTLNLIDLHDNTVVRRCEIPGVPAPGTLVVSPDGKIAYTLTAAFSDVYGVSLDT